MILGVRSLVLLLFTATIAILGLLHISPSSDHTIYFNHDAPERILLQNLKKGYGATDNITIVIYADSSPLYHDAFFTALKKLETDLLTLPYLASYQSPLSATRPKLTPFGTVKEEPYLSPVLSIGRQKEALQALVRSPLAQGFVLNKELSVAGIQCSFDLPPAEHAAVQVIQNNVDSLLHTHLDSLAPAILYAVSGGLYIDNAFTEAGMRDTILLTPLMVGLISLTLFLFFRSSKILLLFVATVFLNPLLVMGVAGWLHIAFSPSLAVVPIITLAISVATAIHVLIALYHVAQGQPITPAMITTTMNEIRRPLFYTSLTTIVGFLTLNMSATPPFRTLGNLAALGTTFAFLQAYFVLPSLILPLKIKLKTENFERLEPKIIAIRTGVLAYPKVVVSITVLLLLLTLPGLTMLKNNETFRNYFGKSIPFRVQSDITTKKLTGIDYLQLSLATQSLHDSAYLAKVDSLTIWCEAQPSVKKVLSLPMILTESYRQIAPESTGLPSEGIRKSIIKEMQKPSLRRPIIHSEGNASQIFIQFDEISAHNLRQFAKQLEEEARRSFAPKDITIGSTSLLFAQLSETNTTSMHRGMLFSLFLITLILLGLTRSLRLGILTILPNLLPVLITFGLWGLVMHQSGLGISIVIPVSLGIIVDDTVHFITHYTRYRGEGMSKEGALIKSYHTLGFAVILTSFVLFVTFLSLAISPFQPTREMGILTAGTLLFALLGDLILLPTLLLLFDKD